MSQLSNTGTSRLPPWYVDSQARVWHHAPDHQYEEVWSQEEMISVRHILDAIFETAAPCPILRERMCYTLAAATGLEIPQATVNQIRSAAKAEEMNRAGGGEPQTTKGKTKDKKKKKT